METLIYAYMTAEVCSVIRFYTTKNKFVVEIHQKIIQVKRSSVCQYKWCIDRCHKMCKEGRTVVGDKVPEVVLQQCDLKKLSNRCTICRKRTDALIDTETPFAPTHPQFTTISSFFGEFWQQICFSSYPKKWLHSRKIFLLHFLGKCCFIQKKLLDEKYSKPHFP